MTCYPYDVIAGECGAAGSAGGDTCPPAGSLHPGTPGAPSLFRCVPKGAYCSWNSLETSLLTFYGHYEVLLTFLRTGDIWPI